MGTTTTATRVFFDLVKGYGTGEPKWLDAWHVDIEFSSMHAAATCAETLLADETDAELAELLPRPVIKADFPEGISYSSLHVPVTVRFVLNESWVRKLAV